MTTEKIRVRFAPSPTGHLHIGGARTALFNWLWARHTGGTFILRIEDTDTGRSLPEHTQAIIDGLRWMGVDWDEGPEAGGPCAPYLQSQRTNLYREKKNQLAAHGLIYPCFCTKEALDAARAAHDAESKSRDKTRDEHVSKGFKYPGTCRDLTADAVRARLAAGEKAVWRLKMPEGAGSFPDLIHGDIPYDFARFDDFIIWRSDDTPMFHFTVVVDDATMGITHVLRGDDHISNTPRQLAIFKALGAVPPRYGHIPLILGQDKAKLSKRHGETSVQAYRDLGFLPDAFCNALTLFGWSDSASTQFYTRAELVAAFTPERINDTAAVFDLDKMKWLNQQHLQRLSAEQRLAAVEDYLRRQPGLTLPPRGQLAAALAVAGERYQLLSEAWPVIRYLFAAPVEFTDPQVAKVLRGDAAKPALDGALAMLAGQDDWSVAALEAALRLLPEKLGLGMGKVMQPLRVAVCGSTASPGLFESLNFIGKEETLRRLQHCRATLA